MRHCYIILETGVSIFSYTTKGVSAKLIDETLVSGFLGALINFMKEVSGQEIIMVETKQFKWHFKQFGIMWVVLIQDPIEDERESKQLVTTIGNAFAKNYGAHLLNWKGKTNEFKSFTNMIRKILERQEVSAIEDKKYIFEELHDLKAIIFTDPVKNVLQKLEKNNDLFLSSFPGFIIQSAITQISKITKALKKQDPLGPMNLSTQQELSNAIEEWLVLVKDTDLVS